MSIFHELVVKEILLETSDAISISLEIPQSLKSDYKFIAGQYITIKYKLKKETLRRAYSICSSPNSEEFRIAIKRVKSGLFSNYAFSKLKVGDKLDVSLPQGKFILRTEEVSKKNYIAFAAGSGITPILAMIKSVLQSEKNSNFFLIYVNKTPADCIFKTEIERLQKEYNNFNVEYFYSRSFTDTIHFGRIDNAKVNYIIKKLYKNIDFDEVFICGPEEMSQSIKKSLIDLDISELNIHIELFTTMLETSVKADKKLEGAAEVTVLLDDEEYTFSMAKDTIILDEALKHDLDAPYSCQGGICSSCLAKLTEGEVVMDNNAILSESEIKEGLILTCQAHPITDKISIDYDDV